MSVIMVECMMIGHVVWYDACDDDDDGCNDGGGKLYSIMKGRIRNGVASPVSTHSKAPMSYKSEGKAKETEKKGGDISFSYSSFPLIMS